MLIPSSSFFWHLLLLLLRVNLFLCCIFAINWSFHFHVLFISVCFLAMAIPCHKLWIYIVAGSYGEVYHADWNGTVSQIF